MSLGGNSAGDGFLIAPLGTHYEAELSLLTDAATANVTLQASPNPANLIFSNAGPIAINSTTPTIVKVHSLLQSGSRGDTTIQVFEVGNPVPVINFAVTSISHPVAHFKGRFEARFATDGARPYANPMYTAVLDTVVPPGRTWGLEGEPDFCPGSVVPNHLDDPGMGRVVRLNNPAASRGPVGMNLGEVRPVVSTVDSITGETATNLAEKFTTGDPLIGLPVNFGPDTYLAGNNNSTDTPGSPAPEEYHGAGLEPLALFEINIGNSFSPPAIYFRGKPQVSAFTHKATMVNEQTRTTDSRPITPPSGIANATAADFAEFSLGTQQQYSDARMDVLIAAYNALPAGPSTNRRNLNRRIGHLLGACSAAKKTQVQNNPPGPFSQRTATVPVDWNGKEVFTGKIDDSLSLHAWPGGPTGVSPVVAYLTEFFKFDIEWSAFAFHTDENCGHHTGKLSGDLSWTGNHIGDPHVHTVNGIAYDFQAAGEFTLLRDGHRMEIQTRQTPVATANPIQDSYSGLTACVCINTAVAVCLGSHRISLQPGREGKLLQFYVDGKAANFPRESLDLGANRVTAFAASGETGIRIDFADGTVVTITPRFWNANSVWYLDVSVSNTRAAQGIMGLVPKGSWLPRLRNGTDLGPKPASLNDRYVALYRTFADSWRVTKKTSLFVYAPGTSTQTFTDRDWPAAQPPCKLKPQFQIPGVRVQRGIPLAEAEMICKVVTDKDLHNNCVFDVATTGDEIFARGYVLAQEIRLYGTLVRIGCYERSSNPNRSADVPAGVVLPQRDHLVVVTATVLPLTPGRPIPTGSVTFFIDGVPMNRPVQLDDRGRASVTVGHLKPGEYKIRAAYSGGGKFDYHCSSSANLLHTVTPKEDDQYNKPKDKDVKPRQAHKGPGLKDPKAHRKPPSRTAKGRQARAVRRR